MEGDTTTPKYVRWKYSAAATKWKVDGEDTVCWKAAAVDDYIHYLLKSEYIECEPPERWEDVTSGCEIEDDGRGDCQVMHEQMSRFTRSRWGDDYRLRKIYMSIRSGNELASAATGECGWAFIVERKIGRV